MPEKLVLGAVISYSSNAKLEEKKIIKGLNKIKNKLISGKKESKKVNTPKVKVALSKEDEDGGTLDVGSDDEEEEEEEDEDNKDNEKKDKIDNDDKKVKKIEESKNEDNAPTENSTSNESKDNSVTNNFEEEKNSE